MSALQSLLKEQQKKFNKSFVDKTIDVLFERSGRHEDQYIGRSIYNQSVFINNQEDLIGKNRNVLINRSTDFALEGKLSER